MQFSGWSGADKSNNTTAYVTISGDKTVTSGRAIEAQMDCLAGILQVMTADGLPETLSLTLTPQMGLVTQPFGIPRI